MLFIIIFVLILFLPLQQMGVFLGLFLVFIGLFTFVSTYKELPILTNFPAYKIYQKVGRKDFPKFYFYLFSFAAVVIGLFLTLGGVFNFIGN
ncbi:MAG: hypothetical protein KJ858_03830 [Nanoarchaeota archaeon]|nr:hypothetical protein [Nanoarchaeota archaeon]